MDLLNHNHPTEDEMEMYSMHKAMEAVVENIEEHLLACESCRQELDSVERKIRVLKLVLREYESHSTVQ